MITVPSDGHSEIERLDALLTRGRAVGLGYVWREICALLEELTEPKALNRTLAHLDAALDEPQADPNQHLWPYYRRAPQRWVERLFKGQREPRVEAARVLELPPSLSEEGMARLAASPELSRMLWLDGNSLTLKPAWLRPLQRDQPSRARSARGGPLLRAPPIALALLRREAERGDEAGLEGAPPAECLPLRLRLLKMGTATQRRSGPQIYAQ